MIHPSPSLGIISFNDSPWAPNSQSFKSTVLKKTSKHYLCIHLLKLPLWSRAQRWIRHSSTLKKSLVSWRRQTRGRTNKNLMSSVRMWWKFRKQWHWEGGLDIWGRNRTMIFRPSVTWEGDMWAKTWSGQRLHKEHAKQREQPEQRSRGQSAWRIPIPARKLMGLDVVCKGGVEGGEFG